MSQQSITDVSMVVSVENPGNFRLMLNKPRDGDRVAMVGRLDPSGHEITIECEYRDPAYRVARVTITARGDGELTSAVLGMPVKETADRMLAQVWARAGDLIDTSIGGAGGNPAEWEVSEARFLRRQGRRLIDDDFLRQVADVYEAAQQSGARAVIKVVASTLGGAGYSTAQRWVAEARRRGFLPPARQGSTGAGDDGR